jgi:hypothetical protein
MMHRVQFPVVRGTMRRTPNGLISMVAVAALPLWGCSNGPQAPGENLGPQVSSVAGTTGSTAAGASTGSPAPVAGTVAVAAAGTGGTMVGNACPVTIFQQCKACHDGKGTAGAPMGLLTYEDLRAPSHTNAAIPVFKMIQTRVHDTVKPMPMTGQLPAADLAVIDAWVAGGAPDCGFAHAAQAAAGAGAAAGSGAMTAGAGAMNAGRAATGDIAKYLSPDSTHFIKEPPGTLPVGPDAPDAEFCFNMVAHGAQKALATDSTPFSVPVKEFYHEFDFKVPYTKTMVALSTKPIIDNSQVLHHWLLFHIQSDTGTDGAHQDEVGLQLGKELVSGWAPGGDPPELPPGVGLEMPKVGGFMTLETHYFNNTPMAQPDRSGVRVCMTSKMPANVATLTWLGTEGINIPAKQQGTATGTCTPGVQSGDIHLIYASPHMHQAGTHMKTVINRKGGAQEIVVDMPFAFTDQRTYTTPNIVHPGDTLTTTCTWQNTTNAAIGFGTSTTAEMCYNFVYSYPAHSLPNPLGGGIEGSSNMCLL